VRWRTPTTLHIDDFGAVPNDAGAEAANDAAIAAAVTAAENLLASTNSNIPLIMAGPGAYHISATMALKSAGLVCEGAVGSGTKFVWDGANGTTMVSHASAATAGNSAWRLEHCRFNSGSGTPGIMLDLTGTTGKVDSRARLYNLHFDGTSSGAAIKVPGYFALQWDKIRFDHIGGPLLHIVADDTQFLSTFRLGEFYVDTASVSPTELFLLDNSAGSSNWGLLEFSTFRIEVNAAMGSPKAMFRLISPSAGGQNNNAGVSIIVRNGNLQDLATNIDTLFHCEGGSSVHFAAQMDWFAVQGVESFFTGSCDTETSIQAAAHGGNTIGNKTLTHWVNRHASGAYVDRPMMWAHATNCLSLTWVTFGETCRDADDGRLWLCTTPAAGGTSTKCDNSADWTQIVPGPNVSSVTCTDNGTGSAGTLTIQPAGFTVVNVTNSDIHGCTVTLGETSAVSGWQVVLVVISNAGGTVNFADTAGVSHLAGALTADVNDTLTLVYSNNAWNEVSRSAN
jgi:hypothetical protein